MSWGGVSDTRTADRRPVLRVDGLSVAYKQGNDWLNAVERISFSVTRGEALGLVGESGCGKSTLALQLLGYRHPRARVTAGQVLFDGRNLLALDEPALRRLRGARIAYVPQNPGMSLNPARRVGELVAELLLSHGGANSAEAASARVSELWREVGLSSVVSIGRRYPHQLSGGQQQRVAIAMALACRPDLVVLDEPTTGLDVTTQKTVILLLKELRARFGMSMLYVTHDLALLQEFADRVAVMYAGQLVEIAPTSELFKTPMHPYTRGLIASVPSFNARPEALVALKGMLRREELPVGCPFFPRCDQAEPICATMSQKLDAVSDSHQVACHRWRAVSAGVGPRGEGRAPAGPTVESPAQRLEPLLEIGNLSLRYHEPGRLSRLLSRSFAPPIVHDLSFAIGRGETFALVGESGSGKSTIARAISGLLAPVSGTIRFEGSDLPSASARRSREQRRRIQMIFQNPDGSLNPRRRIGHILSRPLSVLLRLDDKEHRPRIERALGDVQLPVKYIDRYPDQLSGGERQRVAIARALIAEPEILVCDEVLTALDVSVQANILKLLLKLKSETRISMLFISHDLAVVRSIADHVGVLFRGCLIETGAKEEVFEPPFHPYTRDLLMAMPGSVSAGPAAPGKADAVTAAAADRGCLFFGRCPFHLGQLCQETPPPWRKAGPSLRIRCHMPVEDLHRLTAVKGRRTEDLAVQSGR